MTTQIRIQHLDSAFECESVEAVPVTQISGFNPGETPEWKDGTPVRLAGKGDESTIYLHSGQRLLDCTWMPYQKGQAAKAD